MQVYVYVYVHAYGLGKVWYGTLWSGMVRAGYGMLCMHVYVYNDEYNCCEFETTCLQWHLQVQSINIFRLRMQTMNLDI